LRRSSSSSSSSSGGSKELPVLLSDHFGMLLQLEPV
jgi:hypothetical protein